MSPLALTLSIFGIMLVLMAIRIPIAVTMFAAGAIGYVMQTGWSPFANFLNTAAFARFASYDLSVIPLFILMGNFATQGGISKALFDFDKAVLKPEGKSKLDALVAKLKGTDIEVIVATGHTDWTGTETYNQKLSMRRAQSVKAYLVSKGISQGRLSWKGFGFSQPVIKGAKTEEEHQQNRRTEIKILKI